MEERAVEWASQARKRHLDDLKEYLRIPTVSSDPARADMMHKGAWYTATLLRRAGFTKVETIQTPGHPVVVGRWQEAADRPTVLVYGHYDVQPTDPRELWYRDPFDPHELNGRLIARGSADDKGQVIMHIHAVEAILRTRGELPVNVIFIIEGEEEIGSPNLADFLSEHRATLGADLALISDSPLWAEGIPAICVGLRGLVLGEITLRGPNRDLHSGSFGGAVANPAEMLARLLAQVKDENGTIRIPHFYDKVRPISPQERAAIAALPFDRDHYLAGLGVGEDWGEREYTILERLWRRPTFEINGMWSGFTGVGSKTVLPALAQAKISFRLVPDQEPDEIMALAASFFRERLPPGVTFELYRFPGGGKAVEVAPEVPGLRSCQRALAAGFGREPVVVWEGGSIPIVSDFKRILGLNTLLIGFCLPDANTHSPNENLHLSTYHTGIESLIRLYHNLGKELSVPG